MLMVLLNQIMRKRGIEKLIDVEVLLYQGIVAFIVPSSVRDCQP